MAFDHFGPSRDLLYLCFLFFGGALGSFLITLRRTCTLRSRSGWITAALFFVSFALAALAGSVILSRGLIFTVRQLYLPAVLFFILGAAALYFPRAGGCTAVLFGGLFAVWLCFSFFVYPGFDEPFRLTIRSSREGELMIRRDIAGEAGGNINGRAGRGAETWYISEGPVMFEASMVTAHPAYPLIGGECRGLITRVSRNGEELFALANSFRFRHSGGLGFILDQYGLELPMGVLLPGVNITVLFNGQELYFDPPIQL